MQLIAVVSPKERATVERALYQAGSFFFAADGFFGCGFVRLFEVLLHQRHDRLLLVEQSSPRTGGAMMQSGLHEVCVVLIVEVEQDAVRVVGGRFTLHQHLQLAVGVVLRGSQQVLPVGLGQMRSERHQLRPADRSQTLGRNVQAFDVLGDARQIVRLARSKAGRIADTPEIRDVADLLDLAQRLPRSRKLSSKFFARATAFCPSSSTLTLTMQTPP